MVVDDCEPHPMWDGALVAYKEFIKDQGLPHEILHQKLGIIGRTRGTSQES